MVSSTLTRGTELNNGLWLNWLEHLVWDQGTVGSSPTIPTKTKITLIRVVFVFRSLNKFSINYILQNGQTGQKERVMNSYLIVCGVIFNLLVLFAIIGSVITELSIRRDNKKIAAEKARQDALYKEELKLAKQAWQQWARRLAELQRNCDNTTNALDKSRLHLEMARLHRDSYFFSSIKRRCSFSYLGEKNNWVLKEDLEQPAEVING